MYLLVQLVGRFTGPYVHTMSRSCTAACVVSCMSTYLLVTGSLICSLLTHCSPSRFTHVLFTLPHPRTWLVRGICYAGTDWAGQTGSAHTWNHVHVYCIWIVQVPCIVSEKFKFRALHHAYVKKQRRFFTCSSAAAPIHIYIYMHTHTYIYI